jgi:hypothetical protein
MQNTPDPQNTGPSKIEIIYDGIRHSLMFWTILILSLLPLTALFFTALKFQNTHWPVLALLILFLCAFIVTHTRQIDESYYKKFGTRPLRRLYDSDYKNLINHYKEQSSFKVSFEAKMPMPTDTDTESH